MRAAWKRKYNIYYQRTTCILDIILMMVMDEMKMMSFSLIGDDGGDDYDTGHHGDDGHGWDEDDIVSVNRG
ncbi:hypothetical protein QE152_g35808 [Popillia japonica]|uniref:Uncharacterized protein n=1 Tax=Popillia japonica TaxID=7064 RepID=A0AAW1IE69_POPJA